MKQIFYSFFKNDSGATSIEYAFLASLIALVIVGSVTAVGQQLVDIFDSLAEALSL